MFATLQVRLVKKAADAGIMTIAAANRFIAEVYLPAHNRRFMVEAADGHRCIGRYRSDGTALATDQQAT